MGNNPYCRQCGTRRKVTDEYCGECGPRIYEARIQNHLKEKRRKELARVVAFSDVETSEAASGD